MTKATKPEWGIHPIADIFPMMDGPEFEGFKEDIRVNGLRERIVDHEGLVLDGRNRLRACQELGIDPTFVDWDGKGSILGFILSRNVQRRHMTEGQRVVTAARLANLAEGRPTKNAQIQAVSQQKAADLFKVSRTTVQAAKQVLDKGVPELIRAVEHDEVSVSAAALVAAMGRKEQTRLLSQGAKAVTAKAAEVRQTKAEVKGDRTRPHESGDDRRQPVAVGKGVTAGSAPTPPHEAEVEVPRPAPEADDTLDGTTERPRRQTETERPPAVRGRPRNCPVRAGLPESNRARFDRTVDFFERLQPVLDAFRRDHPGVVAETRALCRDGNEPASLLGLALTTKHPRHGLICKLCGGSGHGVFEDCPCIECLGDGFVLARYGPLDMPPGADTELAVVGSNGEDTESLK